MHLSRPEFQEKDAYRHSCATYFRIRSSTVLLNFLDLLSKDHSDIGIDSSFQDFELLSNENILPMECDELFYFASQQQQKKEEKRKNSRQKEEEKIAKTKITQKQKSASNKEANNKQYNNIFSNPE